MSKILLVQLVCNGYQQMTKVAASKEKSEFREISDFLLSEFFQRLYF